MGLDSPPGSPSGWSAGSLRDEFPVSEFHIALHKSRGELSRRTPRHEAGANQTPPTRLAKLEGMALEQRAEVFPVLTGEMTGVVQHD